MEIEVVRGYEVLSDNNIRIGIRITNNTDVVITDVQILLDYNESLLKLQDDKVQKFNSVRPNVPHTAKFVLKPLGCIHKEPIEATITYRDHKWKKHIITMKPKEIHCVYPILRSKPVTKKEFHELSNSGHSIETGINFEGVSTSQLKSFLMQTFANRLYIVDDYSIDGDNVVYFSSESIGEKTKYLLIVLIKEQESFTQIMLRAVSDKNQGIHAFLYEIISELKQMVNTVNSAKEIGVTKHEQVINIIDSVVQRSSFSLNDNPSINVENSIVQRSEIASSTCNPKSIQDQTLEDPSSEKDMKLHGINEDSRNCSVYTDGINKENYHFKNSIGMEFVLIQAEEIDMGLHRPKTDKNAQNEKICSSFLIGKYPVTQKQWKMVMGTNPSYFNDDDFPVEQVSFNDIQIFIEKLNELEECNKYRLPSETEWQCAMLAGGMNNLFLEENKSKIKDYAWIRENSNEMVHKVGQKYPTPMGLYDIMGNVWELVNDEFKNDCSTKISKGGSWKYFAWYCNSKESNFVDEYDRFEDIGFRLLREH